MIRGTTPTHTFELPFAVDDIDQVRIVYAQEGSEILVKTNSDCTLEDSTIRVKLTQDDTLGFKAPGPVEIQIRVLMTNGDVLASSVMRVPVGVCLDNEVMA